MRTKGSTLILWVLVACFVEGSGGALAADPKGLLLGQACDDVRSRRAESVRRYTDALLNVATECAKLGLADDGARAIESLVRLHLPERGRLPRLSAVDEAALPEPALKETVLPDDVRASVRDTRNALSESRARFDSSGVRQEAVSAVERSELRARRDFVKDLSRLANQCVDDGFPALGYEVVLWTLQFDPENARLRKALRQKPWTDESTGETRWYAPFDHARATSGKIDDPRYGWVTPEALRRLESGEAWSGSQWLPRKRVRELRRRWSGRWKHETEHFVIHTNADREDTVAFGREIERFYSFVFRALVDFYAFDDADEATRIVIRRGKDLGRRKLRLHYHRSRDSYLWELRNDPLLRTAASELTTESAGFYWGRNGRAYFYAGPRGLDVTTVFHEATHQILGETYPTGARPPAWLVEGLAVFMERPVIRGRPGTERLVAGSEPPPGVASPPIDINAFIRSRGTSESFHLGARHEHYATAGAIVHFFLLHRGGIHRRAFIQYARAAYQNDLPDDPTPIGTLYKTLDLTEDELRVEWEAFNRGPYLFDF